MFVFFLKLAKLIQNEKGLNTDSIWHDKRGEFQYEKFENFCIENDIKHTFLLHELLNKTT